MVAHDHLKVDGSLVERLLKNGGWPCERIADTTWRSRFRGRKAAFPFFVRIDPEGYLHFAIVPFVKSPEDEKRAHALYDRLLELNHAMMLAKFSIDDDLDVVLSVEYATGELDASEFHDALDVLSYYADQYYEELSSFE